MAQRVDRKAARICLAAMKTHTPLILLSGSCMQTEDLFPYEESCSIPHATIVTQEIADKLTLCGEQGAALCWAATQKPIKQENRKVCVMSGSRRLLQPLAGTDIPEYTLFRRQKEPFTPVRTELMQVKPVFSMGCWELPLQGTGQSGGRICFNYYAGTPAPYQQ